MLENKDIKLIKIDDIVPNRFQPRQVFGEKELNELANSIKQHGIIQPLVVRPLGSKYEIIAGERRFKAASMNGLNDIPAIVVEKDDEESAELAIIENIQRKDLTPIEEANSYKKLISIGLTQEEIAQKLCVAQPTIANKLRLLNLPKEVQDALLYNKISERHARALLKLTSSEEQISLLEKIISEKINVKQTEEEIDKILGNKQSETPIFENDFFQNNTKELKENIEVLSPFVENEEILDIDKLEETQDLFKEIDIKPNDLEIPINKIKIGEKSKKDKKYQYLDTVDKTRDFIEKCKLRGIKINSEEYDMDNEYQIIIKIEK